MQQAEETTPVEVGMKEKTLNELMNEKLNMQIINKVNQNK
jgi:hypothetical protein